MTYRLRLRQASVRPDGDAELWGQGNPASARRVSPYQVYPSEGTSGISPPCRRSLHLREKPVVPQVNTNWLPGERALQQEFGLAPVTIRKAIHALRDEGLVRTTPGMGTYVVHQD